MIRRILAFAVFAIVAILVIKVAFGLLGALIGLAVTLLVLAGMGYVLYLVLRVVSPKTADRVQEIIRGTGRPNTSA